MDRHRIAGRLRIPVGLVLVEGLDHLGVAGPVAERRVQLMLRRLHTVAAGQTVSTEKSGEVLLVDQRAGRIGGLHIGGHHDPRRASVDPHDLRAAVQLVARGDLAGVAHFLLPVKDLHLQIVGNGRQGRLGHGGEHRHHGVHRRSDIARGVRGMIVVGRRRKGRDMFPGGVEDHGVAPLVEQVEPELVIRIGHHKASRLYCASCC